MEFDDLEKFFDTVNHDKLISLVMKDVKAERLYRSLENSLSVESWLIKNIRSQLSEHHKVGI